MNKKQQNELLKCTAIYNTVRFRPQGTRPTDLAEIEGYYDFNHIQGFYVLSSSTIYVMIIGSNEIQDWMFNLWFGKSETPYSTHGEIKVHSGFYHSYLLVRQQITDMIKKKNRQNVVVFGHSLGGAMATLASLDIKYNMPETNVSLYTIGAPRVGNAAFKTSFEKRIPDAIRCVNGNDIVPSVPFKMLGFEHIGECVQLGKRNVAISIRQHRSDRYQTRMMKFFDITNSA